MNEIAAPWWMLVVCGATALPTLIFGWVCVAWLWWKDSQGYAT